MNLAKILENVSYQIKSEELPEIRKITIDSRKVEQGDLFVSVRGRKEDGHRYIPEALQRGAVAVLLDSPKYRELYTTQTTVIYVRDTRKILPKLAAAFYRNPSREIELIGVTGTNGKTSVTTIAHKTFQNLGLKSALIGTIQNSVANKKIDIETTTATTPDCLELHEILRHCCQEEAESVLMEVSSIAMKNHRCDMLDFDIGVFLNLSREHMEDHGTMADFSVVTSDNPRTEDPMQIIKDIEGGMIKDRNNFISIVDRGDSIRYALPRAQPQDVVVIAGKGHETYQIIGDQTIHFSDKEMVLQNLV